MDFKESQRTQQDLQYSEGKRTIRDEILSAYGVGLEILGQTESQTRANAETAVYVLMLFGVTPFLDKFVDSNDNGLVVRSREQGHDPKAMRKITERFESRMQEDPDETEAKEKITAYTSASGTGRWSRNSQMSLSSP